jgi:hypothetical protein
MLKIIIPSYKRAGVNHTIRFMPEEIVKEYVWIAVRDEEYDEYVTAHPGVNIHKTLRPENKTTNTKPP